MSNNKKFYSLRTYVIGITAVLVIGSTSSVLAVPPAKVNPPPFQGFGFQVGDCGDFQVLNDFTSDAFFIVHFDQDGNVTHVNQHIKFSDSTYYNSEYTYISINGGPGEGENDLFIDPFGGEGIIAVTGIAFKITVPGYGVIFHEAGRAIYDFDTDELLYQVGPADFSEENLDALCAALSP